MVNIHQIEEHLSNPPKYYRPFVRWWWFGNALTKEEITREMNLMVLKGIGGVEIQGFSVPSILTRRSETTLELQSGQSFAMAGLLNQSTNARSSRVPLLGDLPILGSLFRSVSYQNGESELIVIVTASLVEPLSHYPARPLPAAELYTVPSDWELFMNGDLFFICRNITAC